MWTHESCLPCSLFINVGLTSTVTDSISFHWFTQVGACSRADSSPPSLSRWDPPSQSCQMNHVTLSPESLLLAGQSALVPSRGHRVLALVRTSWRPRQPSWQVLGEHPSCPFSSRDDGVAPGMRGRAQEPPARGTAQCQGTFGQSRESCWCNCLHRGSKSLVKVPALPLPRQKHKLRGPGVFQLQKTHRCPEALLLEGP